MRIMLNQFGQIFGQSRLSPDCWRIFGKEVVIVLRLDQKIMHCSLAVWDMLQNKPKDCLQASDISGRQASSSTAILITAGTICRAADKASRLFPVTLGLSPTTLITCPVNSLSLRGSRVRHMCSKIKYNPSVLERSWSSKLMSSVVSRDRH